MRRSKKSNIGKKLILPIICIVIVVITFVLLFDMKKKAGNNDRLLGGCELENKNGLIYGAQIYYRF